MGAFRKTVDTFRVYKQYFFLDSDKGMPKFPHFRSEHRKLYSAECILSVNISYTNTKILINKNQVLTSSSSSGW